MSVDLINALDVRANERAEPTASQGAGSGEFPEVLRSTLDDPGQSGEAAKKDLDDSSGENASGDQSDEQSNAETSTQDASSFAEASGGKIDREETDEEDSTLDAAALGIAASVLALVRREGNLSESKLLIDGRLSVQDAERTNVDLAEGRRDLAAGELFDAQAGATQGRELSAEEGAVVAATVDAELAGVADGAKVGQTAEAASGSAALIETNQEGLSTLRAGAEVSEGPERDLSDSGENRREAADDGSRGEQDGQRESEQTRFDRAAEGAQSAAVDPALRQAIANGETAREAPNSVAIEGAGLVANPVAGAVTETTTTSTPGVPTPPAASDAISVQTEWLATRGGGIARLILSPPNLGEIAIQVTLRGGNVDVVMVAHEAIAQSVAEDQADRLAQAFANRDLRMDAFEVRRGDPESLTNGNLGQFAESNTRDESAAEENEAGQRRSGDKEQRVTTQSQNAEQLELAQPQILSVGPEAGVDLRI